MTDLKRSVLAELEATGALDQVKDQVRSLASACLSNSSPNTAFPPSLTEDERLCVHLVRDFLACGKFNLTLNVLEPETGLISAIPESELVRKLGFQPVAGRPILYQLLERANQEDSMELLQDQGFVSSPQDSDIDIDLP